MYFKRSMATAIVATILLIVTSACSSPGSPAAKPSLQLKVSVVARGLEAPWGLAFLPDGRALVSQRDSGKLLVVTASGHVAEVQQLPAHGSGEGGLLGIALSPNYASDGFVYAYFSTVEDNRVVRFRLGEEPEPILTGIPVSGVHNGGRIAFGPDGMLYIGTGDATNRGAAQDRNSLAGKILRVTPDGGVPVDNPFLNSPVYSYGHRNVQGLAWDAKGQLYATEFGQNAFDEVNRIVAGGNYGWPAVEGNAGGDDYIKPVAVFSTAEASPSGAAFLHVGAIPQWEGNLLIAGLRGERLWQLSFDSTGAVRAREPLLQDQYGRLRHVVQAPDGSVWVLTAIAMGVASLLPTMIAFCGSFLMITGVPTGSHSSSRFASGIRIGQGYCQQPWLLSSVVLRLISATLQSEFIPVRYPVREREKRNVETFLHDCY